MHALGQIVHFDTHAIRDIRAWTFGVNTYLPNTIAIQWAERVDEKFHARFSAVSRCYRYVIYNHPVRSAIFSERTTWYQRALDIKPMQKAAEYLLGEQDFSSFRSSQCESKSPMRFVKYIQIERKDRFVVLEIQANAFLHHMVRNIAGVLLSIGAGLKPPEWMQDVLAAKDRTKASDTADPHGLYLYQVNYLAPYLFPENHRALLLF